MYRATNHLRGVGRLIVTDKHAATRSSLTRSYFPPCVSPRVVAVDIVEVVDVAAV